MVTNCPDIIIALISVKSAAVVLKFHPGPETSFNQRHPVIANPKNESEPGEEKELLPQNLSRNTEL